MLWTIAIRGDKLFDRACSFTKNLQSSFYEHSGNQVTGDNLSSHISQHFPRIPLLRDVSSVSFASEAFYFYASMAFWLFLWLYLSFPGLFVHRYIHTHLLAPKKLLTLRCLSSLIFWWGINFFYISCSKKK